MFQYAVITATKLDILLIVEVEGNRAIRCVYWVGTSPRFTKYLRILGKDDTVTAKTGSTPKLRDRGVHCMFVGYAEGHAGDCYQMWNPYTNKVYKSRDVMF